MLPRLTLIFQRVLSAALLLLLGLGQVDATELVYAPINPSFGGNPNNAPGLMSVAQAQNEFKAPVPSPLETFNLNLQRSILSRLSSQAMNTMFGSSYKLSAGNYDTAGYAIQVVDDGDGTLHITTTDKTSGAVATFDINSAGL
jgi:curli production assembly/transport component CsgF